MFSMTASFALANTHKSDFFFFITRAVSWNTPKSYYLVIYTIECFCNVLIVMAHNRSYNLSHHKS